MFIGDQSRRLKAPKMSAFPRRVRPFTEPLTAEKDVVIGPGKSMPDLIRLFYPGAVPYAFGARFGFLERDNKERDYVPQVEDRFVFKNLSSLSVFSDEAKSLIKLLCSQWTEIGLPLAFNEDREIDLPNTEIAWEALDPKHPLHPVVLKYADEIMFITANVDIMKKACVVRTVSPGWWAVSYRGKNTVKPDAFALSLKAHKLAFEAISTSPKFRAHLKDLEQDAGDPIDSNCGYPHFNANIDKDGRPTTRIRTVEGLKGLGKHMTSWELTLSFIDGRYGRYGLPGYPLAVAPLRRLQAGRKWSHQFTTTPGGMITAFDEEGINSQRVAWMVPYIYNLIVIPLQLRLKAFRMMLPGCYHDGAAKIRRLQRLRDMKAANKCWIAEADYSNYDRFIPVDIISHIVKWASSSFPDNTQKFWEEAGMHLHYGSSLLWPDYSTSANGGGWAFKPGLLGLLSGVKLTSETGTIVNSIVNIAVLGECKGWGLSKMVNYLTQYMDKPTGSLQEEFYVMSDDTLLIQSSPLELKRQGDSFINTIRSAGLKGSLEFGDRFLMRHTYGGRDTPVPARVWQNTLSNEAPPESELILLAGLVSRTDGLLGYKTIDPFGTGKNVAISGVEATFTLAVLSSLRKFFDSAAQRSKSAVDFMNLLFDSFPSSESSTFGVSQGRLKAKNGLSKIDGFRKEVIRQLAVFELAQSSSSASDHSWLLKIYNDRNIPSQASLLEQILLMKPDLRKIITAQSGKEHSFFVYAMDTLGLPFKTKEDGSLEF